MYYYNARYYDPTIGRFVSQDPFSKNLKDKKRLISDPQLWSYYTYTLNNPVIYSDPGGEVPQLVVGTMLGSIAVFEYLVGAMVEDYGFLTNNEELHTAGKIMQNEVIEASLSPKSMVLSVAGSGAGKVFKGLSKFSFSRPSVSNKKLNNIVNYLYRNGAKIGNGSTADAVRHQLKTGEFVGGKDHIQKGEESVRALQNWLKKNSDVSTEDINAAKGMLNDLNKALNKK